MIPWGDDAEGSSRRERWFAIMGTHEGGVRWDTRDVERASALVSLYVASRYAYGDDIASMLIGRVLRHDHALNRLMMRAPSMPFDHDDSVGRIRAIAVGLCREC